MQIIAGKHKGRKLFTPLDRGVRPTAAKMREAIFNILINLKPLEDTIVLDLCCGTGSLGIEALSRGAAKAIFIDGSTEHLKLARNNITQIKEEERSVFLRANAIKLPKSQILCDIVFLDPPYNKKVADQALITLISEEWLKPKAIIVIEQDKREDLTYSLKDFQEITSRIYGNSKIILLERI